MSKDIANGEASWIKGYSEVRGQ